MTQNVSVARRNVLICCGLTVLLLSIGCICQQISDVRGQSGEEHSISVTEKQARNIAAGVASGRTNNIEISNATLVRKSFWRVVVDLRRRDGTVTWTNVLPASLSAKEAEQASAAVAKERLGEVPCIVYPAERLKGSYWLVTVWFLPPSPGRFETLTISAEDGSIVKTDPGL